MEEHPTECEPESMDSEDDLFVMFTSGVAKTPKGIVHSQAGYLLHVAVTFKVCTIILSFQVYTLDSLEHPWMMMLSPVALYPSHQAQFIKDSYYN